MVVLEHERLHKTLWGRAAPRGRSARTDTAVYAQLIVYALLGVFCALEYEKPAAVRLGVWAAATLLYFRNTALFVRLMLLLAGLVLYGDVVIPIKRLATTATTTDDIAALPTAKLVLHCVALWNIARILFATFSSGALRSSSRNSNAVRAPNRRAPPGMRVQRKSDKTE